MRGSARFCLVLPSGRTRGPATGWSLSTSSTSVSPSRVRSSISPSGRRRSEPPCVRIRIRYGTPPRHQCRGPLTAAPTSRHVYMSSTKALPSRTTLTTGSGNTPVTRNEVCSNPGCFKTNWRRLGGPCVTVFTAAERAEGESRKNDTDLRRKPDDIR